MAMNELDKETVIALAKNNMNTTDTANQLGLHRNTVLYRYDRMKNRTGLDPRNFYDLHKLVNMATGKEIGEVAHGHMVERIVDHECPWYTVFDCSVCGCSVEKWHNYCPNCGAKMDGDTE